MPITPVTRSLGLGGSLTAGTERRPPRPDPLVTPHFYHVKILHDNVLNVNLDRSSDRRGRAFPSDLAFARRTQPRSVSRQNLPKSVKIIDGCDKRVDRFGVGLDTFYRPELGLAADPKPVVSSPAPMILPSERSAK
jgi:hypothetical protein